MCSSAIQQQSSSRARVRARARVRVRQQLQTRAFWSQMIEPMRGDKNWT